MLLNDYQATIARGENAEPYRIRDTMAFMFESALIPRVCPWALEPPRRDPNYYQCWIGLRSHFSGDKKETTSEGNSTVPGNGEVVQFGGSADS